MASNFKFWLIQSLETLRQANENLTLMIDFDFKNLEEIVDVDVQPKIEFNRKYRKYLSAKQISLLESLEINFGSILNFSDLRNSHSTLIQKLQNMYDRENFGIFPSDFSMEKSQDSGVDHIVPKLDFEFSQVAGKQRERGNSPLNQGLSSLRLGKRKKSHSKKIGFFSPRLEKKLGSGNKFNKTHKRTVSFVEKEKEYPFFKHNFAGLSPRFLNSPNQKEILNIEKSKNFEVNFENFSILVKKLKKFLSLNSEVDDDDGLGGEKIEMCLEEIEDIKKSLKKKISTKENSLEISKPEYKNLVEKFDESEIENISSEKLNRLSLKEHQLGLRSAKSKSVKEFIESEILKLEIKIKEYSEKMILKEKELKEKNKILKDLYQNFLEKETKVESFKRQEIAIDVHLKKLHENIKEVEEGLGEVKKEVERKKIELELEQKKLEVMLQKEKDVKDECICLDDKIFESQKKIKEVKDIVLEFLKKKVKMEVENDDLLLKGEMMSSYR